MISWVKHYNNTSHLPSMRRIIDTYGYQGYGIYNCVLERVMQLNGLISLNQLMHEFCSRHISTARIKDIILMSEMFTVSEDDMVTITVLNEGKQPAGTLNSAPANLLNTKEKKERNKKDSSIEALISASVSDTEKEFYLRMQTEFPRICQMQQPLTFTEMQRLLNDFPRERILTVLNDMDNYPRLLTSYVSANKTCRKWLQR